MNLFICLPKIKGFSVFIIFPCRSYNQMRTVPAPPARFSIFQKLEAGNAAARFEASVTKQYAGVNGMDREHPEPMTPFDELVTTPGLQMVKLLLPFLPASGRRVMAAYIKFTELKTAVSLFHSGHGAVSAQMFEDEQYSSPADILNRLRPYLNPGQQSILDMLITVREMMPLMEMLQNTGNTGRSEDSSGAFPTDLSGILAGMLTPEQQDLFRMYSDLFSQSGGNVPKGDDSDERMDEQSGNEEYRSGETGTDPDSV